MPLESDRPKYPGMFAPEAEVWRAWLRVNQKFYDSFEYNVRVGTGDDPGPSFDEALRRGHILNTQRRIDAVGHSVRGVEIIEIKVRAASDVIGQIAMYLHLYPSTFSYSGSISARVVCNECPVDVSKVLKSQQVLLDIMGISIKAPIGSF